MDNSSATYPNVLKLLQSHKKTGGKIAQELNVNRSVVYQSIDGQGSRRVRVHIAKIIGSPPSFLWPNNDRKSLLIDDLTFGGFL